MTRIFQCCQTTNIDQITPTECTHGRITSLRIGQVKPGFNLCSKLFSTDTAFTTGGEPNPRRHSTAYSSHSPADVSSTRKLGACAGTCAGRREHSTTVDAGKNGRRAKEKVSDARFQEESTECSGRNGHDWKPGRVRYETMEIRD